MTPAEALAEALLSICPWHREADDGCVYPEGHDDEADAILAALPDGAAIVTEERLAGALADHCHPGSFEGTLLLRHDHIAPYVDGFDCAAAILAAIKDPRP
jgi:hypothetical protein